MLIIIRLKTVIESVISKVFCVNTCNNEVILNYYLLYFRKYSILYIKGNVLSKNR